MIHVAILKKSFKLLEKIKCGEKTIESRWYKFKRAPYDKIRIGDTIYFKDSGEPVSVVAEVSKVEQYNHLNEKKIISLLQLYGREICVPVSYASKLSGKQFCVLVWLNDVLSIEPFEIDKMGYGNMAAWITVDDIEKIKKNNIKCQ